MDDDNFDGDKIESYILAPEKYIPKDLVYRLINQKKRPELMLSKDNHFIGFLKEYGRQFLQSSLKNLKTINKFNLTQWGGYLALCQNGYLIISEFQTVYLENEVSEKGQQQKYRGFIYIYDRSMYVGDVKSALRSAGQGLLLFRQTQLKKELWHKYEGHWNQGEILEGTRISYKDYASKDIYLEYQGQFKHFQFEGKGKRIVNQKQYEGIFKNGRKFDEKNMPDYSAVLKEVNKSRKQSQHEGSVDKPKSDHSEKQSKEFRREDMIIEVE